MTHCEREKKKKCESTISDILRSTDVISFCMNVAFCREACNEHNSYQETYI